MTVWPDIIILMGCEARQNQKKLADKDSIISELRESIFLLNYRAEYLQITMDGIREVDSTMVDDVIHRLWDSREAE